MKKNVNVRVEIEVLDEFDVIDVGCGIKRADVVRESIEFFRKNGLIFVKVFGKEISYEELLNLCRERIEENADLQEKLEEKKVVKEESSVDLPKSYDNVIQAVNKLGKDLFSNEKARMESERQTTEYSQ